MANRYEVICNRVDGPMAVCDDLQHAGQIVDALMRTRHDPKWLDYWVRDEAGNEYYHDAYHGTVFSAACFAEA